MALIYRIPKGLPLTYEEGDANLLYLDKMQVISITSPTSTDDISKGFEVDKSIWIDKTTGKEYFCTDNTLDNAVWEEKLIPVEVPPTNPYWSYTTMYISEGVPTLNIYTEYYIDSTNVTEANLPSADNYDRFKIIDYKGIFDVNNLTLLYDGINTIMGLAEDLVLDVKNASIELVHINGDWRLV